MKQREVVYVVPRPGGNWGVFREGTDRASSMHDRKVDAIAKAKAIAASADLGQIKIHRQSGRDPDRAHLRE